MSRFDCVVLGSGVLGLTIALELTKRGLRVAVAAKDLAEDATSTGFASPWAGCNWCSFATNKREEQWDEGSFKAFYQLARARPDLCEMIPFWDVHNEDKADAEKAWFKDLAPDFRLETDSSKVPGPFQRAVTYRSFILNAPEYLLYLSRTLASKGVPIIRKRLSSLDEAYNLSEFGQVDFVVNATGLGSYSILGVHDEACMPIRGQTVLVNAPGVKTCVMAVAPKGSDGDSSGAKQEPRYIIPRPGTNHVILGGCFETGSFQTVPDLKLAENILKDCYDLWPALAGPNGQSWRDIEIVGHNVGLRPAREGGCRLELEKFTVGDQSKSLVPKAGLDQPKRSCAVLHAYGIGPAGYQASVGLAEEAADIAEKHLASLKDEQSS